jgi:4-amino-4-deoxy-L-arabinose transferase-like glycosyltransferase
MTLAAFLDRFATPGRAPIVAALVALMAALPGLFTLPPTDRDESRFAEASAQMLESGDFTNIMFQDTPRYKKPVGIYWLQAASVRALSSVERREIWAYRIPSLLGAMLAAGAAAWGALAFVKPREALAAGALLAVTLVLSTESTLATTDAALCGAVTLSLAAMGRVYMAARGGPPASRWVGLLFWIGMAAAVLLKGPIGPMVAVLTALALAFWERRARWLAGLTWDWGVIVFCGLVLPWALAITVATDGGFWGVAVGGDLAPKLFGGQEGHGAPPGYFAVLSPLLLFPAVLLLPAALLRGWAARAEPGVRFALCWLVPSWIVFELVPTKLPHYTLPCFGALAWLMAAALREPLGARVRWLGGGLAATVAVGFIVAAALAAAVYGGPVSWVWVGMVALSMATAAGSALVFGARRRTGLTVALTCGFGVLGHGLLVGGLAPTLGGIWLSERVADQVSEAGRQGFSKGPTAVAGYAEPSLVFALGAPTELGSAKGAADAIGEGRMAVVEQRQDAAFRQAIAAGWVSAHVAGVVRGLDYSTGHAQILRLYVPIPAQPAPPAPRSS